MTPVPDAELSRLRLAASGPFSVADGRDFLQALEDSYDSLVAFESIMIEMQQRERRGRRYRPDPFYSQTWGWSLPIDVGSRVRPSDKLILSAVRIESPGFWELLGNANPLEVIRKYLKDRHERRRDTGWRDDRAAETWSLHNERLRLENAALETSVMRDRLALLHELELSDEELKPLLNQLVHRPLEQLDRFQDQGIVDAPEEEPEL